MENAEEIFQVLEEFSKRKPKTIPQELNEYLAYVARTGDPVYQWALVKSLFKEKLLNVITDFYETTPGIDIPPYPNVDPFNYDIMKDSLLERLDTFSSAPFTVQRICELLTFPRKQYNRVDKFMRAIEKNILVVSTREPGLQRHIEQENGEPAEPIVNGSDNNSDYNVDVEMEDVSWKENTEQQNTEPQPSSSDSHINVDNVETSPQTKQDDPMDTQEKTNIQAETVVEPVQSAQGDVNPQISENKISEPISSEPAPPVPETSNEVLKSSDTTLQTDNKDVEMKTETTPNVLIIPEIKVDDAEMTDQKLMESENTVESAKEENTIENSEIEVPKASVEPPQAINDDSCSSAVSKEDITEQKVISEVSTSSEESSSSSDNTDGNSNSPKTDPEIQTDVPVESIEESNSKEVLENSVKAEEVINETPEQTEPSDDSPKITIETDNYSISDVNSEIKEIPPAVECKLEETKAETINDEKTEDKPAEKSEPESTDKEIPVSSD